MPDTQRIKLIISYDGACFHGFQRQQNGESVQSALENALYRIFGSFITVSGCSRTDAGVHAEQFVAHFDIPAFFPAARLYLAMNTFLPESVRAYSSEQVSDSFNSRFDCISKTYRYDFVYSHVPSPFYINRAWQVNRTLDIDIMSEAAQYFIGTHDFSGFMASGSDAKSTIRTVNSVKIEEKPASGAFPEAQKVSFFVNANGFLYNMVRIMAGTLVYVSYGKLPYRLDRIIEKKKRAETGITAPPYGLYLYRVYYNDVQTTKN